MEINEIILKPYPRELNINDECEDMYLTIKIGNGQIGGSKVILDDKIIAKGNLEEPTFIGNIETLNEKTLEIETNVLDVNTFINRCVITTSLIDQNNNIVYSKIDKGLAPENGIASFKGKYILNFVMLFIFFFSFLSNHSNAQSSVNEIEYSSLETPASPGLILFDNTPSSIEKPTTPQGLSLGIISIGQSGGAIDFAPFWLVDHPNFTAEKIYKNKVPVLSHLTLSLASAQTDTANFISMGLRTRFYQNYGKIETKLDKIKSELELALAEKEINRIDSLKNEYSKLLSKPIFSIEFAGAIGSNEDPYSISEININRWAAWLNFNFRPNGDKFYFTILTRYINYEFIENNTLYHDLVDLGSRLNYDFNKLTISAEYIQRLNISSEIFNDYRIAAIFSYKFSDNLFLTTTFGKNFFEASEIIALAGINIGISNNKLNAF